MPMLSTRQRIDRIPIIGIIRAGAASDNYEESIQLLAGIQDICPAARAGDFFLEVTGDSMIDVGIRPGQLALMRPGIVPKQGEICAVWINGEGGTLKRLFVGENEARLVPENPAYETKTYPLSDLQVQGVLIATIDIRLF